MLVTTGVLYHGRAIVFKFPHAFVVTLSAFDQIFGLVAFQSALFTVIFSAIAHITLQRRHCCYEHKKSSDCQQKSAHGCGS